MENGDDQAGRPRRGEASIWPRRQRRGEPSSWPRRGDTSSCFNLATTSASWRTRKPAAASPGCGMLQFGHDVSVVENPDTLLGNMIAMSASIWPRRQRRGEPTGRPPCGRSSASFNLATTSASWRTAAPTRAYADKVALQFGHDVSVVENENVVRVGVGQRPASIWPRRQRRGERPTGSNLAAFRTASIWPRRQRRGERERKPGDTTVSPGLQFGHDVSVVENGPAGPRPGAGFRFNLATTSASWRTVAGDHPLAELFQASIWPRRQRRGERPPSN